MVYKYLLMELSIYGRRLFESAGLSEWTRHQTEYNTVSCSSQVVYARWIHATNQLVCLFSIIEFPFIVCLCWSVVTNYFGRFQLSER